MAAHRQARPRQRAGGAGARTRPDRRRPHPDELIGAILRAPVDLLWNGGIGTYVKASTERHAEVGDRANDAVRVDGRDLRCRIVAEGGNLGLTQLGRVEFALAGGLVNTDAIDNSAGVDCSDHEVNIKIALDHVLASGRLDRAGRDRLLAEMTDAVAAHVLADNHAQNLALAIARTQAAPMADVHARQIRSMELAGRIDRAVEFLPDEQQLAARHAAGTGLTTPEFAVLLAYTKDTTAAAVLASDLPDDPALATVLSGYFPEPLRERFADAVDAHPLRREIVTTVVVNTVVNHAGLSFEHRMAEETSASAPDILRAHLSAARLFGLDDLWRRIDALSGTIGPQDQIELFLALRRMVERSSLWLLRHRRHPLDLVATQAAFGAGAAALAAAFPRLVSGALATTVEATVQRRVAAGVPADLATASAAWPYLHTVLDTVEISEAAGVPVLRAAGVYWALFDRLDLAWLWDRISALPRNDRWQTQARAALRDDLLSELRALAVRVLAEPSAAGPLTTATDPADADAARELGVRLTDAWTAGHEPAVRRSAAVLADIVSSGAFDLSTLTVALRQLRNLAAPVTG